MPRKKKGDTSPRKTRKRNAEERARDIGLVARLYLQGRSQRQIADVLNSRAGIPYRLSHVSVFHDIQKAQETWLASALIDIDEFKARQLAKLDLVEQEAWEAWEKSKVQGSTTIRRKIEYKADQPQKSDNPGDLTQTKDAGDIQYLKLALDCVKERNALVGITKLAINFFTQQAAPPTTEKARDSLQDISKAVTDMSKEDLMELVHGDPDSVDYLDFEELENGEG